MFISTNYWDTSDDDSLNVLSISRHKSVNQNAYTECFIIFYVFPTTLIISLFLTRLLKLKRGVLKTFFQTTHFRIEVKPHYSTHSLHVFQY